MLVRISDLKDPHVRGRLSHRRYRLVAKKGEGTFSEVARLNLVVHPDMSGRS